MKPFFRCWFWLGLGMTCLPVFAGEGDGLGSGYGPFPLGERNPLYTLFYTPQPEGAATLPAGDYQLDWGLAYSNIFERGRGEEYLQDFDLERLDQDWVLRRGLHDGFEVGLRATVRSGWGGFLDHGIQEFHRAFGLPNDNREDVDDGRSVLYFGQLDSAPVLDGRVNSLEVGDTALFAKWRLGRGASAWQRGLKLTLKVPSGGASSSSGRVDPAIELFLTRVGARYRFDTTAALIGLNAPAHLQAVTRPFAFFFAQSVEYRYARHLSFLVQLDLGTPYFEKVGLQTLDELSANLSLGIAGGRAGGWTYRLGFAEDITAKGPAVDFSLILGVSRHF